MLEKMLDVELEWFIRILCAAVMGALIGYERHTRSKDAGIRTHTIVAIASALLMIISQYFFNVSADPGRIAAQVVSGVGFLGAGIIFVRHDLILGLTTAAGIWATSALGLCFGAGFYMLGFFVGLLIIAVQLLVFRYFNFSSTRTSMDLLILMNNNGSAKDVSALFHRMGYSQSDNTITKAEEDGYWYLKTGIIATKNISPSEVISKLEALDGVESAKLR